MITKIKNKTTYVLLNKKHLNIGNINLYRLIYAILKRYVEVLIVLNWSLYGSNI